MKDSDLHRKLSMSSETTLISASDGDIEDLIHSIIELERKTSAKLLDQTNALIRLSSLQQELNSTLSLIRNLQKEAGEKMNQVRPLTFEAQFLKDHLNSNLKIERRVSGSTLEEMSISFKEFIVSIPVLDHTDFEYLPDFGSDHELELIKIANKYKSHDTSPLKLELYNNIYNAEVQRLEFISARVSSIKSDIIIYQHKIKEAQRIKSIYMERLSDLNREIQFLTDRIFSLQKLRNAIKKDSRNNIMDDSDDDGYYTPDEDVEA